MKKYNSIFLFLLFLTHVMFEKVLFLGQIFEMEILMDLHAMRPPDLKIKFLAFRLCECVSVISITQKQITDEISSLVFYVYIIYKCYWELFIKDLGEKLCTGAKKEF